MGSIDNKHCIREGPEIDLLSQLKQPQLQQKFVVHKSIQIKLFFF